MITGHTGFKGSWLSALMLMAGANVTGCSLPPENEYCNYNLLNLDGRMDSRMVDIRDMEKLEGVFEDSTPDIVFHLAAQPIVTLSYSQPKYTYETNVMGTLNTLECIRKSKTTKAAVIITTDKCYKNNEQIWGYRENDPFGGDDPYSSSKACAEILVESYTKSFLTAEGKFTATARAGNVIGGGDWSFNRIIPDCIRAFEDGAPVIIRNPNAIRPWQHVTEPLFGYIMLAEKLFNDSFYVGGWNFGPDYDSVISVRDICSLLIKSWGSGLADESFSAHGEKLHESTLLSLDCTKAKTYLGWRPSLTVEEAVELTVEWYKSYRLVDVYDLCLRQARFVANKSI